MRIPQKVFVGHDPDYSWSVRRFGKLIGMNIYVINNHYYLNMLKDNNPEAYEIDKFQYNHYVRDYWKSFAEYQTEGDNFAIKALDCHKKGEEDLAAFYWGASIIQHNKAMEARR